MIVGHLSFSKASFNMVKIMEKLRHQMILKILKTRITPESHNEATNGKCKIPKKSLISLEAPWLSKPWPESKEDQESSEKMPIWKMVLLTIVIAVVSILIATVVLCIYLLLANTSFGQIHTSD